MDNFVCGCETRIYLDVKTRPWELEVKTNAEATGKTARTCRRELAPKPQLCISNVLWFCQSGSTGLKQLKA